MLFDNVERVLFATNNVNCFRRLPKQCIYQFVCHSKLLFTHVVIHIFSAQMYKDCYNHIIVTLLS